MNTFIVLKLIETSQTSRMVHK